MPDAGATHQSRPCHWLWVAGPECYLDDGADRRDLEPAAGFNPTSRWTCAPETKAGDTALLLLLGVPARGRLARQLLRHDSILVSKARSLHETQGGSSPRARLAAGLNWWDVLGIALLSGIGFTVPLLIGELAFGPGSAQDGNVKIGVLLGSLLSALLATVVLRVRNRHYREMEALEERDADADGVPDVHEADGSHR